MKFIPPELLEFESELKKLPPQEFSHKVNAVPRMENRTESRFYSRFEKLATLCVGILIGSVLGAGAVYFLLRSDSNETVAIDAPSPTEEIAMKMEPVEEIPKQITPSGPDPFDLDAMISQHLNRRKALPQLSQFRSFSAPSTDLLQSISDPNSLIQLRSSQIFNEI